VARIDESTFAIVSNGHVDGPAQALRDHLVRRGARRVTTVFHPLGAEDGGVHEVALFEHGVARGGRRVRLPSRPPLTYPLDLLVPVRAPRADAWFGFNALACARGLVPRRAGTVVYWCVDYTDERFGTGPVTRAFNAIDGFCCRRADARFELSESARAARDARHTGDGLAPSHVVPMGAWLDRLPVTPEHGHAARRVVFLGHLVERQGVSTLLAALAVLGERGVQVSADVAGRGPLEEALRREAAELGLGESVTFHGFIPRHEDVERVLAAASVGVAPYEAGSFTQYADPGKLKAYLAAGLPIVTTDVPPNAGELEQAGAAVLVDGSPAGLADAIERLLDTPDEWRTRRDASLALARRYDWPVILDDALARIGFEA
jgi:glycosyltransferase involved in cell wall biosynthesis